MKRYLPYLLLFVALAVSTSAAFYSVYGLSKLFSGAAVPVIIMASSLEIAKLIIAGSLHTYWDEMTKLLKYYLTFAIIVLAVITSMGIYGFLSDAFQQTYTKDRYVQTEIDILKKTQSRYQEQIQLKNLEKSKIDENISKLRNSLTENAQTQFIKNGQILTNIIPTSKKSIEKQLEYSTQLSIKLDSTIASNTDSVSKLDLQIINLERNSETASELGPLKYIQELTGKPMNVIVNWFLIMLILVFDPLSIALVVAALFAFKQVQSENTVNGPEADNISPEPELTPPTSVTELIVKPKRKYVRKNKPVLEDNPTPILEVETPLNDVIPNPPTEMVDTNIQKKRPYRKRKIVESGLTPNIALHMSESINSKKKVKKG